MAYNLLTTLKRGLVVELAQILPSDTVVEYAWPGSKYQKPVHVWTANGSTVSQPSTMRAGRKRRDQRVTFDVIIECYETAKTVDAQGVNVLQEVADEKVETIAGLIDEWIADNPLLGQTTTSSLPVDYATFDGFTLTHGPTDTGCAARAVCTISVRLRPL